MFNPAGTLLTSASEDHTVRLWDIPRPTPVATLTGHTDQVRAVAFSPDGHTLATASTNGTGLSGSRSRSGDASMGATAAGSSMRKDKASVR